LETIPMRASLLCLLLLGLLAGWVGLGASSVRADAVSDSGAEAMSDSGADEFTAWMAALQQEARTRGISEATLATTLATVKPRPAVLELDRSQPRKPGDFCGYLEKRLTRTRIARGQRELATHRDLLRRIVAQYGVPARYLVALWGLETNFGDYQGDHPLFDALVTLARDPRRGDLFRQQIFAALEIVEAGHPPENMSASWAGAMGHVQFMPTTYQRYAVDWDGDGRKDVWSSVPDALASAANFLRALGWRSGETWGREVHLPASLASRSEALRGTRSLEDWRELGVRRIDGDPLPTGRLPGRIVLPRRTPAPAFLVYPNYKIFMSWNRSTFFSISVGTLADEIAGRSSLQACRG
jgi:membrane-bound lytic murein transglycosylase B